MSLIWSKVVWEHHSSINILHQKNQLQSRKVSKSKFALVLLKIFLYDSLEAMEFGESKLLWAQNGLKFILERFFFNSQGSIKSWLKLALNQMASSLVDANDSDCSKTHMGTVYFTCRPSSLLVMAAAVVGGSKICFYAAEMGQRVGYE